MEVVVLIVAIALAWKLIKWLIGRPRTLEARELLQQLQRTPQMSGAQFEHFVASILQAMGHRAVVQGGSGDQGVDIVANLNGVKAAIQCKNYARPVGNKPVQEVFAGARYHGCARSIVVAPLGFTKGAVSLAQSIGVELADVGDLRNWILQIRASEESEKTPTPDSAPTPDTDPDSRELAPEGTPREKDHHHLVNVRAGSLKESVTFHAHLVAAVPLKDGVDEAQALFFELPNGRWRVLVVGGGDSVLQPSDQLEAMQAGRNAFEYGSWSTEELRSDPDYGGLFVDFVENRRYS